MATRWLLTMAPISTKKCSAIPSSNPVKAHGNSGASGRIATDRALKGSECGKGNAARETPAFAMDLNGMSKSAMTNLAMIGPSRVGRTGPSGHNAPSHAEAERWNVVGFAKTLIIIAEAKTTK